MPTAILRQPAGWPSVLLGRAGKAAAADGLAGAEKLGAWTAWKGAVQQGPEAVIRAVGDAGLRGRGGAGYPTADKWRAVRAQAAPVRYAVANGYEADPGTMVDRTLMEVDPHAVLEGLALAVTGEERRARSKARLGIPEADGGQDHRGDRTSHHDADLNAPCVYLLHAIRLEHEDLA